MKRTFVINLFWLLIISCKAQIVGPGYNFNLFDSTSNQALARAVENDNINEIKKIVSKGDIKIDLQEPKFGNTLLMLAVGNDKINSVKALLEAGANINLRDYDNNAPINEASKIYLHGDYSSSYQMLKLLIEHGADVNSVKKGKGTDSSHYEIPLCNTVENYKCAKLLLDNGADPNFKRNNTYLVWLNLLNDFDKESIFIAHYIILEKKMLLPIGIIWYGSNGKEFNMYNLLNANDFPEDSKKRKAREEILDYLNEIGYPKN